MSFRIPNLFRSLFGEGAFNVAFVPFILLGTLEKDGKAAAQSILPIRPFHPCFFILLIFVLMMEVFMPFAMYAFAPGFSAIPGKIEATVELAPYSLFLICCSSPWFLCSLGVLNSIEKFAVAAATPILLNLTMIIALFALTPFYPNAGTCPDLWIISWRNYSTDLDWI